MKPRSAKAKGTRLEKEIARLLAEIGIPEARRQPGSGIYQGFDHDVRARLPDGELLVECKSWRHGWRTGDRAIGKADLLVIKRDHGEPRFYLPKRTMERLLRLANAGKE
jgi:hypothetical protein